MTHFENLSHATISGVVAFVINFLLYDNFAAAIFVSAPVTFITVLAMYYGIDFYYEYKARREQDKE